MIGRFFYSCEERPLDVLVDLQWRGGSPGGVVRAPDWVLDKLEGNDFALKANDEFMQLPFALSYGVLVASAAHAKLTFCGDRSAWMDVWGTLVDRPSELVTVPYQGRFRSH